MLFQTYNVHLFPPVVQLFAALRGDVAVKDDALRVKEICTALRQTSADIILLTEVWSYALEITSTLAPQYPWAFAPVRTDWLKGRFLGSGLLLLSKYPFDPKFTAYKASAGDDRFANKGFIEATLHGCGGSSAIRVFGTHLQAGSEYAIPRRAQLHQLCSAIRSRDRDSATVVVLGDLNVSDESNEYLDLSDLFAELGLLDADSQQRQATVGFGNSLQRLFSGHERTARLDYVFAPPRALRWVASQPKHLCSCALWHTFKHRYVLVPSGEDLSDHYPLLARVVPGD